LQAGGVSVILGLAADNDKVTFHPSTLLYGRTWTSGLFGGYKGKTDLPGLVEKYMDGVKMKLLSLSVLIKKILFKPQNTSGHFCSLD
jgi:Zn-dependent alcohol dehydrogenase